MSWFFRHSIEFRSRLKNLDFPIQTPKIYFKQYTLNINENEIVIIHLLTYLYISFIQSFQKKKKRKSFLKVHYHYMIIIISNIIQNDLNSNTICLYKNKTILIYSLNISYLLLKKSRRTKTNIVNLIINPYEIKNVLIKVRLKSRVR